MSFTVDNAEGQKWIDGLGFNGIGTMLKTLGEGLGLLDKSGTVDNTNLIDGIDNMFTGNIDYKREVELLNQQMAFNSAEAEKERQWQEKMRDSSYMSQINQYKALGLNPYLALGGSGASASMGATASASGSHRSSSGSNIANILSSFIGSATRMATAEMNKEASLDMAMMSRNAKEYQANMLAKHKMEIAHQKLDFEKYKYEDTKKYYASRDWLRNNRYYESKISKNHYFSDARAYENIFKSF